MSGGRGLSKNAPRLLSRVGGKSRDEYDNVSREGSLSSPAGSNDSLGKRPSFKSLKENIDPLSDDTSLGSGRRRSNTSLHRSDDSQGEIPPSSASIKPVVFRRLSGNSDLSDGDFDIDKDKSGRVSASIKRTVFASSKPKSRSRGSSEAPQESARDTSGAKRRKISDERKDGGTKKVNEKAQKSSSQQSGKSPTSSGDHLVDDFGFTKPRSKVTKTFGSKSKTVPTKKSSQAKPATFGKTKGKAKDKKPSFIAHHSDPEEESQEEGPQTFKKSGILDSSPAKAMATKFKGLGDDDDSDALLSTPKSKPRGKKSQSRESEEPESQAPKFKLVDDNDINLDRAHSPLSDLGLEEADIPKKPDAAQEEPTKPSIAVCPWCGESVDEQMLKDFSKGKRLNVRQQTRFCHKHKKQKALDEWTAKSYPTIDWDALPSRIATHYDLLLKVIDGNRPSFYRNKLAQKIEAGMDRALKKEENLNPGYYGPRGFNLMCDCLVVQFGDMLKPKAVHDRVISGRGSAAFIQSVLVAELAVQLVKEDMDIPEDEAREIMEDSKIIGEMIHDEG